MKLYHYTTIDSFTKIWLSQRLLFSEYKNANDLFERSKVLVGSDIYKVPNCHYNGNDYGVILSEAFDFFRSVLKEYRQISFCKDTEDGCEGCLLPMMWGQYANNEKGVCMEFEKDKLPIIKGKMMLHEVIYSDSIPAICFNGEVLLSKKNIIQFIENNHISYFFTKHKNWEQENEFRIVSRSFEYLSITDAVNAIYVLEPDSLETKLVKTLVGGKIPIRYLDIDVFDKNSGSYLISQDLTEWEGERNAMIEFLKEEKRLI